MILSSQLYLASTWHDIDGEHLEYGASQSKVVDNR